MGKNLISVKELVFTRGGYSKQELNEISRIAFLYLYQDPTARHDAKLEPSDKAGSAAAFACCVFEACARERKRSREITSRQEACTFLREATGLSRVKAWLIRPTGKDVLLASGEMEKFTKLWDFSTEAITSLTTLEGLKEASQEYFSWFRLIELVIARATKEERMTLFKGGRAYKKHVFLNLIIAVTLGRPFKRFVRKEVQDFIDIVADYDRWRETFHDHLEAFIADKELFESISKDVQFQEIVTALAKKHKRSILVLGQWITWQPREARVFKDAVMAMKECARHGVKDRIVGVRKKGAAEADIAEFNNKLLRIHPLKLCKLVQQYPFLLEWISEQIALRLVVLTPDDSPLRGYLECMPDGVWARMNSLSKKKMSLKDILSNLWDKKPLFGMDFTDQLPRPQDDWSLRKTGALQEKGFQDFVKNLLDQTIFKAPLSGLRFWLDALEQTYSLKFPAEFISERLLLALYLTTPKEKLPKYLVATVEAMPIFPWIVNEEGIADFEHRIASSVRVIRAGKGQKFNTDSAEIILQEAGREQTLDTD